MDAKQKDRLRELVVYVIFGVLTTAVSWVTYFLVLWIGKGALGITDEGSPEFYAVRAAGQVLQWIAGVLFAFFTNKKWVFIRADQAVSVWKQLFTFAASRLATFGLETVIVFGTVGLLQAMAYETPTWSILFLNVDISPDLIARLIAAVVVVISNYVLSKLFVFKDKKETVK